MPEVMVEEDESKAGLRGGEIKEISSYLYKCQCRPWVCEHQLNRPKLRCRTRIRTRSWPVAQRQE